MSKLTFTDHSRKFNDLTYIYPVLSRRSQGVSLGINLNVNNACNWRCIYCQVENLVRGKPENIDLKKLELELDYMLNKIVNEDFIKIVEPEALQRFNDISISGNGESTLSKQFLKVVEIIAKLRQKYNLENKVKTILITNGSEIERKDILLALQTLNLNNGEIWFKVDCISEIAMQRINQVNLSLESVIKRLRLAADICKTYIQTCLFKTNIEDPDKNEIELYLDFLSQVKNNIAGVLLYSIARPPALIEGQGLSKVSEQYLENIALRIAKMGINVKFYE